MVFQSLFEYLLYGNWGNNNLPSLSVCFSDGYAPFLSMTSRDTFLNPTDQVVAAPGPGQYDPIIPQGNVKVKLYSD